MVAMEDLSQTIHVALSNAGWSETPHPSRACVSLLHNPNYPGVRLGLAGNSVEIYLTQQAHKAEYAHCVDRADQIDDMLATMHRGLVSRFRPHVELRQNIRERLISLANEWKDSSTEFMSGFIDPSEVDLAREQGQREAYGEAASALQSIINECFHNGRDE